MEMTETALEIKRLYLLKVQNRTIGKLVGLTINQVNRIIYKELGLQSKNQIFKSNEIREIKELYESGFKRRDIQRMKQLSKAKLDYILRT